MIKGMIVKLMEEASEESEHKGFCDSELASNKVTRDSKSETVATLTATIQELSADLGQLAEQLSELASDMTAIDNSLAKATAARSEESARNAETAREAKQAGEAVNQ